MTLNTIVETSPDKRARRRSFAVAVPKTRRQSYARPPKPKPASEAKLSGIEREIRRLSGAHRPHADQPLLPLHAPLQVPPGVKPLARRQSMRRQSLSARRQSIKPATPSCLKKSPSRRRSSKRQCAESPVKESAKRIRWQRELEPEPGYAQPTQSSIRRTRG